MSRIVRFTKSDLTAGDRTMNRFFKAVAEDGSTLDILIEDSKERAEVMALFRPWCDCFTVFTVVEVSRQEWFDWWSSGRKTA